MAYDKKYIEEGNDVGNYLNDREDRIEGAFEGIINNIFHAPRKSGQNLNNAESGFAYYTTDNQNAPQEWIIVLTVDAGANNKFQQAWSIGTPVVYFRNFGQGSWSDWKIIG